MKKIIKTIGTWKKSNFYSHTSEKSSASSLVDAANSSLPIQLLDAVHWPVVLLGSSSTLLNLKEETAQVIFNNSKLSYTCSRHLILSPGAIIALVKIPEKAPA
jgi:hypothetical protein